MGKQGSDSVFTHSGDGTELTTKGDSRRRIRRLVDNSAPAILRRSAKASVSWDAGTVSQVFIDCFYGRFLVVNLM